jgi:hypothetical protein
MLHTMEFDAPDGGRTGLKHGARRSGAGISALLLAGLAAAGCSPRQPPPPQASAPAAKPAAPASPPVAGVTARPPDAFYDPPGNVPARPGALLRLEPLQNVTLPPGMRGWRILYTTTIDDQTPATAVATVFAPENPPPGPRPVIAWAHGTTGLLQRCMPSLASSPTEGIPARPGIVTAGWVVVATDYPFVEKGGPHPYLVGEGEARSVLDSVRAARQIRGLPLGPQTLVWGHSQGGHAALWTGIIAAHYAPDVPLSGVVAIAPAANMQQILAMNVAADKRLGPYLARSYSRFYPDLTFEQALRPEALAAGREMVQLCGFLPPEDPQRIAALGATFDGPALATRTSAELNARLAQNAADRPIAAPLLIAQGLTDVVVPRPATDAYVDGRCSAGQRLEYWTFAGHDHGTIVRPGTPLEEPLLTWTTARFANAPQPAGCGRIAF